LCEFSKEDKKRKLSAAEEFIIEEMKLKEKRNRRDYWITPGIVVKVMNKDLADGKYYKLKGTQLNFNT
jgi:DNA/RNA-binding protein KIN17